LGARHYTGLNHPLIINEINYDPPGGEGYEFIEIYNSSSNVIDISSYAVSGSLQYDFPASTLIQAKEFIVMAKDASLFSNINADVMGWGSQSLPNDWGNLVLLNDSGEEIDFISYSSKFGWPAAQEGEDFSIELRDPGSENIAVQNWKISSSRGGSPGRENRIDFAGNLFINELQADNESTIKDEFDGYDDWIEVYNAGNDKINISNFFISDDFRNLTKHRFVSTNTDWDFINPGEHKILWADGDIEQGAEHLNFRLNNNGEEIVLSYIFDGDTIIVDSVSFNEQKADYSFARKDDGGNEWTEVKMPTPAQRNSYPGLFKQGILLVNGYGLDNQDVINFYNDKALWGKYKISFWDLFAMLSLTGYPESLPEPLGHGSVPLNTLTKYSTVIWTGENNPTELARWNSSPLLQYVKMGGNLFILLKNGSEYINEEMLERIGINWNDNTNYQIMSCMPVYEGLDTISIKTGQYLSAVFDTSLVSNSSKVLFADSEASNQTYGVSVWNKPDNGGWYKDNGGQIILLSGRGYRYESAGLMKNMEFILKNFFEEQDIITDTFDYGDHVITEYKLDQNYPNPFNPLTVIKYDLLKSSDVELKIYDVLGREVITLVNEYQERGRRTAIWNGVDKFNSKVSSGIYFYRISAGKWTDVKKMMLVK
jgi:hypothetical protein